jgi:hypothetical protein
MSKEKQIDKLCNDLNKIFDEEYRERRIITAYHTAKGLYEQGYRKQSENVIEVPCKVGDKAWCIYNYTKPVEFQITILTLSENHYSFVIETKNGVYKHYCDKAFVGKWVFFTREEAEKALAKMKGGE